MDLSSKVMVQLKRVISLVGKILRYLFKDFQKQELVSTRRTFLCPALNIRCALSGFYRYLQGCLGYTDEQTVDETTPLLIRGEDNTRHRSYLIQPVVPVQALKFPPTSLVEDFEDPKRAKISYYSIEPYCTICRKEFPPESDWELDTAGDLSAGSSYLWQYDLLAGKSHFLLYL